MSRQLIQVEKKPNVVRLLQAFQKAKANGTLRVVKTFTEIEGGIQLSDGTQLLNGAQRRLANEMKANQNN